MLVALLAGVVAWFANWRAVAPPAPEPIDPLSAFDSTSDAVIDRALGQIPVDSTELKQRWMDDIKQIEVAGLTPRQLEHFVRFANARQCTCGCGYTLAACRTFDPTCPVSQPILDALRDSITAGLTGSVVHLRARPDDMPSHPTN
jgi:hypothetical protein